MKFVSAFLVVFVLGALAQTSSAPIAIKDNFGPVMFLRFSPNGGELARLCAFGPVTLFDTASYRRARTFLTEIEQTPEMSMFAYSPDGTRIATSDVHKGTRVWNAADPGKPDRASVQHRPDGSRFWLSVDELYVLDTPLRVLDQDGLLTGFSRDGKLLLTMDAKGHVKVWNTTSWKVEGEPMVTGIRSSVAALAPDGNSVMIGDTKGVLHHWSLATKAEIRTLRTFEGVGSLRTVEFSPDGKTLVGTYTWMPTPKTESAAAIIWNTTSWIAQTQGGYASAAFSQDGKLLALGGYGKGDIGRHIKLIEPASRKEARDIQLPDIMTLQQYLSQVSGGETSPSAKNLPIATEKMPCLVSALAFSPDGNTLAAGCTLDGTVRLVKMVR